MELIYHCRVLNITLQHLLDVLGVVSCAEHHATTCSGCVVVVMECVVVAVVGFWMCCGGGMCWM